MKPPKGPPVFFSIWPWDLLEISWEYHGNIVGYDGIYIDNLCMRYHEWLPNSTPVEGCGKRKPWVSTCFNMFQPSKGGAGFRKNPPLISQNSGLVASLLNSGFYMLLYSDSHWHAVFFGTRIAPLVLTRGYLSEWGMLENSLKGLFLNIFEHPHCEKYASPLAP